MDERKITIEGLNEDNLQGDEHNSTEKTDTDFGRGHNDKQGFSDNPEPNNGDQHYGNNAGYRGYQSQAQPFPPRTGGVYPNRNMPNSNTYNAEVAGNQDRIRNSSGYRHVMPPNYTEAGMGPGGPSGPTGPSGQGRMGYGPNPSYNVPPRKPKNSKSFAFHLLTLVLAAIIGLGSGFGGGLLAAEKNSTETSAKTITIEGTNALNAAKAISAKLMPSVVGISTQQEETYQNIFGGIQRGIVSGVGTGLIVDASGYVLTNSHVVNDGAVDKISVDLYDGREVQGSVLWSDSSLDLAIVKISADNLVAAELGNSDEVSIGDYAVAIGNPLGMNFERSVTQGIISGLNRTITTSAGMNPNSGVVRMEGLLQTDASINSGNSGGPLINSEGKVIGINTAKAQTAEGLGFAIPINTAIPIIDEIKQTGEFKKGYIGISGVDLSIVKEYYQAVDFGTNSGVYIQQIYTESPASAAGLKEGDIIISINGDTVETMTQLQAKLVEYRPGNEIDLTIIRDKVKSNVKVTLGEVTT